MGVKLGLSHRSVNTCKVKCFGEQATKMYIFNKGRCSEKMLNRNAL
jgi:hypothetical protein